MSNKIDLAFEDFVSKISLTESDSDRIESAYRGLTSYLGNNLGDESETAPRCYRQGSFENGTVVVPLEGGEYDVDIIVEYDKWPDDADEALDLLAKTIKDNETYKDMVVSKKSCVRVEYAENNTGKFHVDLVPAKTTGIGTRIEVPRRSEDWHESDPKAYSAWCKAQGETFQDIVKIFKRWRDENETVKSSIKSIQLQVLVAQALDKVEGSLDLSNLVGQTFVALNEIVRDIDSNSPLWNPVLPGENLASRWSETNREHFRKSISSAVGIVNEIDHAQGGEAVLELWRKLFGDDFPNLADYEVEERASTSHRLTLEAQGWTTDLRAEKALLLRVEVATYGPRTRPLKSIEKRALRPDEKLKFTIDQAWIPANSEVWWQVTNTGRHASSINELRGEFIRAKTRNPSRISLNPCEHWESTAYHGTHIVQAFVVLDGMVWGRSNEVEIRVANAGFWRKIRR